MRTLQNVYAGFFVPEFEDKYTEAFKKGQDIFKMENLRRKKMTKAEEQKDPVFTNQYPNLTAGAWSDPSPTFSHRANVRNTGNSVGPQHNVALKVKFDLDAIMRGHEVSPSFFLVEDTSCISGKAMVFHVPGLVVVTLFE